MKKLGLLVCLLLSSGILFSSARDSRVRPCLAAIDFAKQHHTYHNQMDEDARQFIDLLHQQQEQMTYNRERRP